MPLRRVKCKTLQKNNDGLHMGKILVYVSLRCLKNIILKINFFSLIVVVEYFGVFIRVCFGLLFCNKA